MAETCHFSQQHSTRTGTIEEQVFYGDPVAALDSDVIEEKKRPFNESQKNH